MAKIVVSARKIAANRRNALKAGDFARECLLPLADQPEDSARFSRLLRGFRGEFDPRTPLEEFLVERLVQTISRLHGAVRYESACIRRRLAAAKLPADQPPDLPVMPTNARFETLIRYENSLSREFHSVLSDLRKRRECAQAEFAVGSNQHKEVGCANPNVIPTSTPQPP